MNKTYQNHSLTEKNASMGRLEGFTLIELLVVVLIVGILAAIALPQYQKAVLKSRWVQTQVSAKALYDAINRYYLANSTYPSDLSELDIQLQGTLYNDNKKITFGQYVCSYYFGADDATDSMMCTFSPTPLGTRYFLGIKKRYCIATSSSALAQSVCVSAGGRNPGNNGAGMLYYELP